MQLNCTPLQSRLAASLFASCLLVFLYFSLFSPRFAVAQEDGLKVTLPIIIEDLDFDTLHVASERSSGDGHNGNEQREPSYQPEFAAFDRSIIGRAPAGVTALVNNVAEPMNLDAGSIQNFVFEKTAIFGRRSEEQDGAAGLELRAEHDAAVEEREPLSQDEEAELAKRQATKTVFISANTCMQPQPVNRNGTMTTMNPPQLTLYVSTDPDNATPGPMAGAMGKQQQWSEFVEGAVMFNVSASGDVFFGIHAPNVSTAFSGIYNFKVAASVDGWYFSYNNTADSDLLWVDSDSSAALLMTHNLTMSTDPDVDQKVMASPPYVMFAQGVNGRSINGMRYSYCGLANYADIAAMKDGKNAAKVTTGMTKRGPGNLPKQQFYISGLNASTNYVGILATSGNGTNQGDNIPRGGGHVFRATNFTTRVENSNCQMIQDLPFCNETAYRVPSNNVTFSNVTLLALWYDNYAAEMYKNFKRALAQVPCEAPSTQRYSLARNCDDCDRAYKDWLCLVTIPRCEDFSNGAAYLQPRNLAQALPNGDTVDTTGVPGFRNISAFMSSRNPLIDSVVQPGPYKEALPCADMCYTLQQSCPSSLGFTCPLPGGYGYNTSYLDRSVLDSQGVIACNYPGSAYVVSASGMVSVPWVLLLAATVGASVGGLFA